jgi:hypothetical protein
MIFIVNVISLNFAEDYPNYPNEKTSDENENDKFESSKKLNDDQLLIYS